MTWRDGEKLARLRLTHEAERMRDRVDRETRPFQDIVARLTEASMRVSGERLEREILAELASWGECGWTARDLLLVVAHPPS